MFFLFCPTKHFTQIISEIFMEIYPPPIHIYNEFRNKKYTYNYIQ